MKQVHLTLQGKGGVGKSLVASLVAQYLRSCSRPVVVVDGDPVNATLSGYKALDVEQLDLIEGHEINIGNYDSLFGRLIEEDTNFVIDNGPASFLPICDYMLESNAIKMISDSGKQVFIHIVIAGGQSMYETLSDFFRLAKTFPEHVRFAVWLNPYWGPIETEGKTFEEFKVYKTNAERVSGILDLYCVPQTASNDLNDMLISNITFDEVASSPVFGSISKHRLLKAKDKIFGQLAEAI